MALVVGDTSIDIVLDIQVWLYLVFHLLRYRYVCGFRFTFILKSNFQTRYFSPLLLKRNSGIWRFVFSYFIIAFRMYYEKNITSASSEVLWTRCSSLPDGEQQAAQAAMQSVRKAFVNVFVNMFVTCMFGI